MFARLMGLRTISPDKVHRLVQTSEPVTVIDVNSRSSWMQCARPRREQSRPRRLHGQ